MAKNYVENADTASIFSKTKLRILPYAAIVALCGGYIVNSFGGEIKGFIQDKTYEAKKLFDDILSEDESELTFETIDSNTSVVIVNTPEDIEEVEEEPVIIYPEPTSSELLDLGYTFKDVNLDELREINPDINGWFTIDGTRIDYPVFQRDVENIQDDNEIEEANTYYLHNDRYGNNNANGELFIDSRVDLTLGDDSQTIQYSPIIIYGHHMRTGAMFSDIDRYQYDNYVNEHPFGMLYTDSGAYKVEFFAGRKLAPDENGVLYENAFYSQNLDDEYEFYEYINEQKNNSTFESDIDPIYGDKLFVAITCNYSTGRDNSRYALYGRLVKQYTNEYDKEMDMNSDLTLSLRR